MLRTSLLAVCFFFGLHSHFTLAQKPHWKERIDHIYEIKTEKGRKAAAALCRQYLPEAKALNVDTLLWELYYNIGVSLYADSTFLCKKYLDSAYQVAAQAGSNKKIVYTVQATCSTLRKLGQLEQAKAHGTDHLPLLQKMPEAPEVLYGLVREMSIVHRIQGRLDSATYYLLISDSLARETENPSIIHNANQNLINLYNKRKEYREALKISYGVLRDAPWQKNKKLNPMSTFLNMGIAHEGLEAWDSAQFYYDKTLKAAIELKDTIEIANAYSMLGKPFVRQGKNRQSLQLLATARELLEGFQGVDDIWAELHLTSGEAHLQLGQTEKAIAALKLSIQYAQRAKMQDLEWRASLLLIELYKKKRTAAKGEQLIMTQDVDEINALHSALQLQTQLYEKSRMQLTEELNTKYETAVKEKRILQLQLEKTATETSLAKRNQYLLFGSILASQIILVLILFGKSRLASKQRDLEKSKQKMLLSQVNPHFMNNALNAIQATVLSNAPKDLAAGQIGRFARLMRQILIFSQEEFISIEEEVTFLENYLKIQQLRFDVPFRYRVEVDTNIDRFDTCIPAMITQPFVENAIEHGIFSDTSEGLVHILFTLRDQTLEIRIKDNGIGFDKSMKEASRRKKEGASYGIAITKERLRLLRKKGTKLQVDQSTEGGTQVTIVLPLLSDANRILS